MPSKYQSIYELLNMTVAEFTESREWWMEFLSVAANTYKYPFNDQVLIFAQKPDAKAVASFDEWNRKVHRCINRNTPGIALIDSTGERNRLKYVWDVSDTNSRYGNEAYIWSAKPEYYDEIILSLENSFGELSDKSSLSKAIDSAVDNMIEDNIVDYLEELKPDIKGTYLEEYEDKTVREVFKLGLASSVSYVMKLRCGIDVSEYTPDYFQTVLFLNSSNLIDVFGCAVSSITEIGLREIETTVNQLYRDEKKANRTFAGNVNPGYTDIENMKDERSLENGRDNLQTGGRLSDSESDIAEGRGISGTREVRTDEESIPDEQQKSPLGQIAENRGIAEASSRSGLAGSGNGGSLNDGFEEISGNNGTDESGRPDEMGGIDEQSETVGGGNNSQGTDLRLTDEDILFPSVEEQLNIVEQAEAEADKTSAFSVSQEEIDAVITRGSGIQEGKYRIYEQFSKRESSQNNIAFLKDEYGVGGSYPAVSGTEIDEMHDAKGIRITKGNLTNPDARILLTWSQVEKRIKELISVDRYLSRQEKEYYPQYQKEHAAALERVSIGKEFSSLVRDFNDFETQIGNEAAVLNSYILISCASCYMSKEKKTFTRNAEGEFILPIMKEAVRKIIAENTHHKERAEAMLEILSGEKSREFEPTFDEMNPPPEKPKEYKFSLGDRVTIGIDEYDILSFDGDEVRLSNVLYPILCESMPRDEFDRKIKENPYNDKYLVEIEEPEDKYDPVSEDFPLDIWHDTFYDIDGDLTMVYYNPDSSSGGQFVECVLNADSILSARDKAGGNVDEFFIQLEAEGSTSLYDKDDESFRNFVDEYSAYSEELMFTRDGNEAEIIDWLIDTAETEKKTEREHPPVNIEKAIPDNHPDWYGRYLEIKDRHPDSLVLYRVGDFYEAFGDDAKTMSMVCDIVLTGRNIGENDRIPMCGVPYHTIEKYTGILVSNGYKVIRSDEPEKEQTLTERIRDFVVDYDFYDDKPENGEDVLTRIENDLTVPDKVLAMYKWFCDTEFSTEKESLAANDIAEKLHTVYIDRQKKLLIGKEVIIDESPFRIESISEIGEDVSMLDVNARYPINRVEKLSFVLEKLAENQKSSLPIGRIDYLHTDGTVRESTEYTSEYQLKKDLKEELYYGVPLTLVLYRDENGKKADFSNFSDEMDTPPVGFEIIDAPYLDKKEEPKLNTIVLELGETDNGDLGYTEKPEAPKTPKKGSIAPTVLYSDIRSSYRSNFNIEDNAIGEGTPSERYHNNITAIRLLKKLEDEHRLADTNEQRFLAEYVGWGGLADVFNENNSKYNELKELLTEEEYIAARESTLTAFYTPPVVIKAMYKVIENLGFSRGNILEPSCGIGNFMGLIPDNISASSVYGVELDSISGRIAQQLYQKNSVAISGYESTNLPDSFFDVAIGNVPFGQFKVSDKKYDKNNWLIHDYFFGKTIDKVRPGGIIAFITSKGTMDKENSSVRRYISQRCELLGAIRLPNNTFKNAAGTEVTSDIIFLQKRDRVVDMEDSWVHLSTDENGIRMNSYYVDNPEMIMGNMRIVSGMFGPVPECIPVDGADLSSMLNEAVESIKGQITEYAAEITDEDTVDNAIPADPNVRNYSYTVYDGKVYYRQNSMMNPVEAPETQLNRIRGMIAIRDVTRTLLEYQTEDYPDDEIKIQQEKLNRVYDEFVKKYGYINDKANYRAFSSDDSYFLLTSLEQFDDEGKYKGKTDMFTKRTVKQKINVTSVDTVSEALTLSLAEKTRIDMEYMSELTGKSADELYSELEGVIFRNPEYTDGVSSVEEFLAADEYLSGNIRTKLQTAKLAAQNEPDKYGINVSSLEKVLPKDIPASDISVRLGATWLPTDIVEKFLFEFFKTPRYAQWNIHVKYSTITGEWNIEGKAYDKYNINATSTYGTSRMNGYKIFEETLNLKDVRVFDYIEDENGSKKPVLNKKETAIAQGKQELIKEAFREWIWADPERREKLVELYNEKFNSVRPREFDGSHLNFVGINPEIELRQHQKNAIAHILYGGNTLLAHVVGAGKTFEMVAAAQESKRLGLCSKALFVVPNHIIEQFASEYLQLYPAANILVSTKKDFETKNRKKFCARISTGDYDAVIIGHSQFEKIPMSLARQRAILEQQRDEILEGIEEMKRSRGNNFTVKQLEKAKKQINAKLDKLNDQSRKDDVVTFEELGVDMLFVDEAHGYKNLACFTKMRNVGGISQTEAQKSSDLYMKCRYMDELTGGRGIVFATGTPISNSMVEMFTMQKYLQYNTLKQNDLIHFDAWASTFGETQVQVELNPEGSGYRAKTRFSRFYNLPELMSMFKQIADIQTADMLNLPVPKANYHSIVLKPSEQQKELVAKLSERAERVRNKMVDSSVDNMLCITNDGRKLALDQRMLNPLLPDSPTSKVNACAQNVYEIWERTKANRSTQMVFCDLSTPRSDGTFSVYNDLRDKLIAKGIPETEIAFIHSADTDTKKQEMFRKVNNGQIRVIMGSTPKMGAGTNAQRLLIALHHLDIGWRPSDIQQREGRIIRQKNTNTEVEIFTYVTEGTFDSYMWQLVENKQKFIGQIMTSKSPVRSAEDIDETALSYAEIKALCAGDDRIKEKMTLDADVAKLKLMKANHLSQKYALEDKILKDFPLRIKTLEERIAGYSEDIAHLKENTIPGEDGFCPMEIEGRVYTDKKTAGTKLLSECKAMTNCEPKTIGEYRGFRMELSFDTFSREYILTLKNALKHSTPLGTDIYGNIVRLDNVLADFEKKQELCKEQLDTAIEQLETAKVEVEKPFLQEEELKTKTARLAVLNSELNIDKTENDIVDSESEVSEDKETERTDNFDAR